MIYLASPYTDPDPEVVADRVKKAAEWTALAWLDGYTVFSPVAHGQALVDTGLRLPHTHDFWLEHDLRFLERSKALWVLMLPGWEASKGVDMEINWWNENRHHRGLPPTKYFRPNEHPFNISDKVA